MPHPRPAASRSALSPRATPGWSRCCGLWSKASAIGSSPRAGAGGRDAVVIPCEGHTYALLVEEVEDVIAADAPPVPLAAPVGAGWDRVAIGTVEVGADLFLLVDPYLLIAGPAANAA